MKILVTGVAGFIGAATAVKLLQENQTVVGVDSLNDYYDISLKYARLEILRKFSNFSFIKLNLAGKEKTEEVFKDGNFDFVVHLAAQGGVRYSLIHPETYIESNITAFLNILEGCRHHHIKHLVYASSSSVYGLSKEVPFKESQNTDKPVSLYAATKKSCELMAHSYSYNFDIPTTGLRFFSVYGPWGRPDMSTYLFIKGILNDLPIKVFNNGDMLRDFTYIDDVVEGIWRILWKIPESTGFSGPYKIYNIGGGNPVNLIDYISEIEKVIGKKAKIQYEAMQSGDVYQTYADSSELLKICGFSPITRLEDGIKKTVDWYKAYHNLP